MERISSSVGGSRSYNDDDHAIAEANLQFGVEFQQLMTENLVPVAPAASETGNSFTALLGLPANQAMELLHEPEPGESPVSPDNEIRLDDQWRCERKVIHSFSCTPTFPSNKDLVERAARYSIFAAAAAATEDSPESSYVPSNSTGNSPKLKSEPTDESESSPSSSNLVVSNVKQKSAKRKEIEKKVKAFGKRTKDVEKHGDQSKDGEELPYVHVRARRGQATDSHSLAERARREKINARMKLLQELVPGCSKISGTALVLDEIINHVQALQRQVELLSMRLASVNPRIDFNLDSIMPSEDGCLMVGVGTFPSLVEPSMGPDIQGRNTSGGSQLYPNQNWQQQFWHLDVLQPPTGERDENQNFITNPEDSIFSYNSSSNSENIHVNQLKMEI